MITTAGLSETIAGQLSEQLQQRGASTAVIPSLTLADPERFATCIQELKQAGSITGIIHLAALTPEAPAPTVTDWQDQTQRHCKSLFQLLNLCGPDLQQAVQHQRGGHVLAASLLGGQFGRNGQCGPGAITAGCYTGILKTMALEWPGIKAKAVDLDASLSPSQVTHCLLQELLALDEIIEVGYPQGQRTLFEFTPAPWPQSPTPLLPTAEWVALITGGARGITAEIAAELTPFGLTLILMGRSPEPEPEPEITRDITELSELRHILVQQAREQNQSITPVAIERAIQALLRDRAIRQNLAQFRQSGCQVEYQVGDVRDPEQLGQVLASIYQRFGRLDLVVHGAGIIEDKLIVDKKLEVFERVFSTKANSIYGLSQYLQPETLKFLFVFGSVAGTFGNRGQVDYAGANELMNRMAWSLDQRWPQTRIAVANWGPWDVTGMASEAVNRQFRERGVTPIHPDEGRGFFINELKFGTKGQVELIAGYGPWDPQHPVHQQTPEIHSSAPSDRPFPLVRDTPTLLPNSVVTLNHTLAVTSDPYLLDHCMDHPVLPAAGGLEWMAELVQSAWPEWVVAEVEDLRVLKGIVLQEQISKPILIQARAAAHADASAVQIAVEISNPDHNQMHYRAKVIIKPQLETAPTLMVTPLSQGVAVDSSYIYEKVLFHGPLFQLILQVDQLTDRGLDAWLKPSSPSMWINQSLDSGWIFDPGLVDVGPQAAWIWSRLKHTTSALPTRFGRVTRYRGYPLPQRLRFHFRVTKWDDPMLLWEAFYLDESGSIVMHMQDMQSTCNSALNRFP